MSSLLAVPGRLLLVCVLVYLGICLYVFFRQRAMLYHPEAVSEETMHGIARANGCSRWNDASGNPLGWATDAGDAGNPVLILHGNAGHALNRVSLIAKLREAGVTSKVYLTDYPGYGSSPGHPDEAGLTAAATAALGALPFPAIVVGESLGTGVAAQAAARLPEKIRGLVLITPFDSMTTAAARHYPWLPVSALLVDRFDSVKALAKFTGPVAILAAANDETTPPALGKRLFDSLPGPKKLWIVPHADHNSAAFELPDSEWRALWNFVSSKHQH